MVPRRLIHRSCEKIMLVTFLTMRVRAQRTDWALQPPPHPPLLTCKARAAVSTQQAVKQREKPRRSRNLRPKSSTTNTCRGGGGGQAGRLSSPARQEAAPLLEPPAQEVLRLSPKPPF